MKLFKKLVFLLIPLFVLSGCSPKEDKVTKETDAWKFKQMHEALNDTTRDNDGKTIRSITIAEDNPMVIVTENDIIDMINNKESFVVYFGFTDCPWCRSMLPTMIDVANDLNVEKIYYVDVKDIRDVMELNEKGKPITTKEGTEGYYKLLELLDNVLNDYKLTNEKGKTISTGEKRIFAPNVVAIVDGKPEKMAMGISEKQTDAYMELTDEMKTDMYNDLKCLMECLIDNNSFCKPEGC